MMVNPEADSGRLQGNPVWVNIEEGAAMRGVEFVLNAG